jgi:CRP-like cAMP-binding protein
MSKETFFRKIRAYSSLSEQAENDWAELLEKKHYRKGSDFIAEGQIPRKAAFVLKGIFSQHYTSSDGSSVIKYFFPEQRIAASVSAMLLGKPSAFTITSLESSVVLEYSFAAFKKLVARHPDIAAFYIRYMEQHWIIEKEPMEISLRHDSAMTRYAAFVREHPQLLKRLKQHHIASYLGIAPESLSRIKKDLAAVARRA